eukprot:Gb_30149 [translate_table: standard]
MNRCIGRVKEAKQAKAPLQVAPTQIITSLHNGTSSLRSAIGEIHSNINEHYNALQSKSEEMGKVILLAFHKTKETEDRQDLVDNEIVEDSLMSASPKRMSKAEELANQAINLGQETRQLGDHTPPRLVTIAKEVTTSLDQQHVNQPSVEEVSPSQPQPPKTQHKPTDLPKSVEPQSQPKEINEDVTTYRIQPTPKTTQSKRMPSLAPTSINGFSFLSTFSLHPALSITSTEDGMEEEEEEQPQGPISPTNITNPTNPANGKEKENIPSSLKKVKKIS